MLSPALAILFMRMQKGKIRKKVKEIKSKVESEKKFTIPTALNISRVLLTFVVAYMIIIGSSIVNIVIVFSIAALTDWFDGRIARKYNLVNSFGAKADMAADRFLWVGTALVLVIVWGMNGQFENIHFLQLFLMFMREIIALPFALVALFSGSVFPSARYVAKATTFMQGFALPALMLSVYYPSWIYVSFPLSIAIAVTGTISGLYYIKDVSKLNEQ